MIDNPIYRAWLDATNCYLAGMGKPPLRPRVKAPCESLVLADDLERHLETCDACLGGWSVFDRPESEERKLDDPRHSQCKHGRFEE